MAGVLSFGGIVTLTFDEGRKTVHSKAFPLMKQFNFRGVIFALTGYIGRYWLGPPGKVELMSWRDMREMAEVGWEIGSHTVNHCTLTIISSEELERELSESKKMLKAKGYNPVSIAYPGSVVNSRVAEVVKRYYLMGRIASHPMYWQPTFNEKPVYRYFVKCVTLTEKNFSESGVKKFLDEVKERDAWAVFLFHSIVDKVKDPADEISTRNFVRMLEMVKEREFTVSTMEEVHRKFGNLMSEVSPELSHYGSSLEYWSSNLEAGWGYVAYAVSRLRIVKIAVRRFLLGTWLGEKLYRRFIVRKS